MNVVTNNPYILVVDDDPGILGVYEIVIKDLGFHPILARDGVQGLQKVAEFNPQLILVDYRMPGVDGIDFVRQIRGRGLSDSRIIFVSAGRNIERLALDAGATECLEKPFDFDDLLAVIQRNLCTANVLTA